MTLSSFYPYIKRFAPELGLFLACYTAGYIGLLLYPTETYIPFLGVPAALALAGLVRYGYRVWPAVALGSFLLGLSVGMGAVSALCVALGNTLQGLLGVYVLQHYAGFNPALLRLRDNVSFVLVALASSVVGASFGIVAIAVQETLTISALSGLWGTWWVADTLGMLVVVPFVFKWSAPPLFKRTHLQYFELGAIFFVVLAVSIFIFWMPQDHFAYYLFIPLTWAALRTGPRGTTLAIFTAALVAISGTLTGHGSYAAQPSVYLQLFIGTTSSLFLIFAGIIEERKKMQAFLGRHVDELEEALHKISSEDEAKRDFLAILAHELRNPLASVLSSVELLRLQEVHAPDTAELLQTIDEHVHAMTGMLDDLLDVSRISQHKLNLRKEVLSLDSIIDRSVRSAQVLIRGRGHTLSVIKPEHELFLEADPIRLEQILVNLLNNAAKYTNPQGSIELVARQEGSEAVIRIRDNGIGISKNMMKHIFEPFFQVERGKLATEGLGVGLPLTRQLVEMHQGTIDAASEGEGKGSEFTVRLPLPERATSPRATEPGRRAGRALRHVKNTRSILVVDDNEVAASSLGRLLELRGHEVSIAHSGSEAIFKAQQSHPQIILLDIGLPDIDGYEVVRILKEKRGFPSIFIALTGYGQPQDKEHALEAGFNLHLTKPVSLKEIEAAFRKVNAL